MFCPFCSHEETKVLESRALDNTMRRRRECFSCSNRFTTYEKAVFNLNVQKKDGSIQAFDLQKTQNSIQKALAKADEELINNITQKVEQRILRKKANPVKTTLIGGYVLQELKKQDKIAYLRFASIYKEIDDPKILKKELSSIV